MNGLTAGFGCWFIHPRGAWRVACKPCNGIIGPQRDLYIGFFGVCLVVPERSL